MLVELVAYEELLRGSPVDFFFKLCPIGRLNYLPIAFATGLPA